MHLHDFEAFDVVVRNVQLGEWTLRELRVLQQTIA